MSFGLTWSLCQALQAGTGQEKRLLVGQDNIASVDSSDSSSIGLVCSVNLNLNSSRRCNLAPCQAFIEQMVKLA